MNESAVHVESNSEQGREASEKRGRGRLGREKREEGGREGERHRDGGRGGGVSAEGRHVMIPCVSSFLLHFFFCFFCFYCWLNLFDPLPPAKGG